MDTLLGLPVIYESTALIPSFRLVNGKIVRSLVEPRIGGMHPKWRDESGYLMSDSPARCANCLSPFRFYRQKGETFFLHCGHCLKTLIIEGPGDPCPKEPESMTA